MALDASPIVARYRAGLPDMPKHARLRAAIAEAVSAGELPVGFKMLGERELSELLGVSLGTTQKALGRLMQEGFLVRRQGHGTFVGSARQPVAGSWHYRFVGEDGEELPVFASILERDRITAEGPWSLAFGPDPEGYVRLARAIDVGGKFVCASQMYLPASRFAKLLRMAEKRLTDVNLKQLLEGEFAAPTLDSKGVAHVVELDARDCRTMRVPRGSWGMRVDIVGYTYGHAPFTFQRMSVPPTPYGLKLDFGPPTGSAR